MGAEVKVRVDHSLAAMSGTGSRSSGNSREGGSPVEPKVTPQETELALLLVEDKLGDTVARVARAVTSKGQATLQDVVRGSELPAETVKHGLIILIKHNFVRSYQCTSSQHAANPRSRSRQQQQKRSSHFIYVADPNYMLSLLKFPKWMFRIRSISNAAECSLQALIEHGRLNKHDTLVTTLDLLSRGAGEEAEIEDLDENFATLVKERYVERVPSVLLPPPWHQVLDTSVKRGHKGLKEEMDDINEKQAKAETEYSRMKENRFVIEREEVRTPGKRKRKAGPVIKEEDGGGEAKRPRGVHSTPDRCDSPFSPEELDANQTMWRVNAQEFNERFREDYCLERVDLGLCKEEDSATLRGVLLAYRRSRHMKENNVEALELDDICDAMERDAMEQDEKQGGAKKGKKKKHREKLRAEVRLSLVALRKLHGLDVELIWPIMDKNSGLETGTYYFNMAGLWRALQLTEAECLIERKFGHISRRIFSLLRRNKYLDLDKIKDKAMLKMKTARGCIYDLFKAGYVHCYEVPRDTTNTPSRTFYLWHVDSDLLLHRCRADLYGTMRMIQDKYLKTIKNGKRELDLVESFMTNKNSEDEGKKEQAARDMELIKKEPEILHKIQRLTEVDQYIHDTMMDFDEVASVFTV